MDRDLISPTARARIHARRWALPLGDAHCNRCV